MMIQSGVSMVLWLKKMGKESCDSGEHIRSFSQSFVCLLAYQSREAQPTK